MWHDACPEPQTQTFNLVIMHELSSALPILHSTEGLPPELLLAANERAREMLRQLPAGERQAIDQSGGRQGQGGETCTLLYPGDTKPSTACLAQSTDTRKLG